MYLNVNIVMNWSANCRPLMTFSGHLLRVFGLLSLLLAVQWLPTGVDGNACLSGQCLCMWQRGKQAADCSDRNLKLIPKLDDDTQNIQVINLTRNQFEELKANMFLNSNLINLQKIYLQKVGLEKVDDRAFVKLKNVIELDMSYNNLKYIPSASLTPMIRLRTLDLSSNRITSVPNQSFLNLTGLRTLSLERNRITFIDDNAFDGLSGLESLKLSQNEMRVIGSKVLVPLSHIHSLELSENKWKCDCHLRSVRRYLLANPRVNVIDEPKCADNHKVWTQLGLDAFLCVPVISNYSNSDEKAIEGTTLRLDCSVQLDSEDDDSQPMSIQWWWKNIAITNNSKGCGEDCLIPDKREQYFSITETNKNIKNQKLKISRLEVSSVQSFNSGPYLCVAKNPVGKAERTFDVSITASPANTQTKVTSAAAASPESHYINDSQPNSIEENGTDKVVVGLILGTLIGIMFVLVLFGVSVVLLCRRRRQQRRQQNHTSNHSSIDGQTDGTELEKLTTNSETSLRVNPIQKPPRLNNYNNHHSNNYNLDNEVPQAWIMNRHHLNSNGHSNNSSNNYNYAESDYSTQILVNDNYSENYESIITEPDFGSPSAYVREKQVIETDLDQSDGGHSDGTEV